MIEKVPFEIVHCSSFDQDYEPEYLEPGNSITPTPFVDRKEDSTNRGWQTEKFAEYPQDLILQLRSGLCHISKIEILSHHYKIASQIELYIGITKEQERDAMYIQFTRLGFVTFDSNHRFQDRELKSIKIQADCEYVRLVIKGCHDNRLNIHKQVGLLSLDIFGSSLPAASVNDQDPQHSSLPPPVLTQPSSPLIHHTNADFDLEHWIQVLQNAEEDAVQDEDYKEAKIYKELGDRMTGLWRFIINLEADKQQAIATKDYDEADKIKADMAQVRQTAESLLKQSGIKITRDGDILPYETIISSYSEQEEEEVEEDELIESAGIPNIESAGENDLQKSKLNQAIAPPPTPAPDELLDEAIANWTSFDALSIDPKKTPSDPKPTTSSSPSLLSARIPLVSTKSTKPENKQPIQDPETIPEPLTADDRESCQLAIDQFGQELVACIMSVKLKCRQNGLNQLSQLIQGEEAGVDMEFIHASIQMIQEAIMDSRESIFKQAIQSWQALQELFCDINKDQQLFTWIEKFFSRVLMRTGDSNPGIKTNATKTILDLVETQPALIPFCLKERMIRNLKDAKARVELVRTVTQRLLIPQWKTDPSAYRQNIMSFIVSYFYNHPHADVRKSAWELLVAVAQAQRKETDFKTVCSFLQQDTIRLLQQELRKKKERSTKLKSSTSTTAQELRALANKSNYDDSDDNKSAPAKQKGKTDKRQAGNTSGRTKKEPRGKESSSKPAATQDEETNVCIFCDQIDHNFNEDTLISHYYNQCPVLTNCPMCQIILEVSTLNDHLKEECEKKHLVKPCTQCQESIPVEQWLQHTRKKTCLVTPEGQSRCPFCHLTMATGSTEAEWKAHLTKKCPKNPRKPKK